MAEYNPPHFDGPAENFSRGIAYGEMPAYMGPVQRGKVRDSWVFEREGQTFRVQLTTDRKSAKDIVVGTIPTIGAILNRTSEFWFRETEKIIPNALISIPSDNLAILKQAEEEFDMEFVVRSHMARSSTTTSLWYQYEKGGRRIYGYDFPDNLKPNEELPMGPIITPTTKGRAGGHDIPIDIDDARKRTDIQHGDGYWDFEIAPKVLALFAYGQARLRESGILMVDTKYELAKIRGELTVIDEVHTADSSRHRKLETYDSRVAQGLDPESFDKEPLRDWLTEKGYMNLGDPIPVLDEDIIRRLQNDYGTGYTMLTGKPVPSEFVTIHMLRDVADNAVNELVARGR